MNIDPTKYYRLTVVADSNDADYVRESTKLTGTEIIANVMPIIEALKLWRKKRARDRNLVVPHYNWWNMEYEGREPLPYKVHDLTEDQVEWFNEVAMPSIEGGTHSIEEILISEWTEETRLF